VAENVKAMAAMDVVLAVVVVRDEVANERLAALRSDAARAAFWPKVSIVELRDRVADMAPSFTSSSALLANMSQEPPGAVPALGWPPLCPPLDSCRPSAG